MNADILVVGGGTAVAARLIERTSARVALLEAGPDPGPFGSSQWPADLLDSNRIGTSHDWGYAGRRRRRPHPSVRESARRRRLQQPQRVPTLSPQFCSAVRKLS